MSSYLCLSVIFLDPEFHGRRGNGQPEWPPSPLRFYQALVAASAARWGERQRLEYAVPALKWLAELSKQVPPTIVSPSSTQGTAFSLSVPNNAMDIVARAWCRGNYTGKGDANPATHRAMKTVRPTRFPDGDTVSYLWKLPDQLPEDIRGYVEVLAAASRSLVALGWGIDLVAGNGRIISGEEADHIPGEWWQPTPDPGVEGLRVPTTGTLEALIERHTTFLCRLEGGGLTPPPPLTTFTVVGYRRASDPVPRRWSAFAFYEPDSDRRRSFSAVRAVTVAGMVRSLAGKMARQTRHHEPGCDLDSWVDEYVMGHGEADALRSRFSYLPLLTIRPPNIIGGINRVIIAEPPGGSGEHVTWSRRALRGQILLSKEGREEGLLLNHRARFYDTPVSG